MTIKTIIIKLPDKPSLKSLEITVPWYCVKCGSERGEPKLIHLIDNSIHIWTNPCGHMETFADVYEQSKHCTRTVTFPNGVEGVVCSQCLVPQPYVNPPEDHKRYVCRGCRSYDDMWGREDVAVNKPSFVCRDYVAPDFGPNFLFKK